MPLLLHWYYLVIVVFFSASFQHNANTIHGDQKVQNSETICKPDKYEKIESFLIRHWDNARNELNITEYSERKALTILNDTTCFNILKNPNKKYFLKQFYHFAPGLLLINPNNTIVSYARIWKCANEAFMFNFNKIMKDNYGLPRNKRVEHMNALNSRKKEIEFKSKLRNSNNDTFSSFFRKLNLTDSFKSETSNFKTFTFIRDPLSHFESAIAEMVSRDTLIKEVSSEILKGYISDWLGYRQPCKRYSKDQLSMRLDPNITNKMKFSRGLFFDKVATEHLNTMSGTFFEFDIDIVGHLESFQLDWENKILTTYRGLHGYTFDNSKGSHKTSVNHPKSNTKTSSNTKIIIDKDPQKTRHFYKELLNKEPKVLRAICRMILIEYVCFPEYHLPPECQDMEKDVIEIRTILTTTTNDQKRK